MQLIGGDDGLFVIDIVEDHQPGRMGVQPTQRGLDLDRVLRRLLLRQIENLDARERGQARVQFRRIAGAHEQHRRVLRLAPQRIFDREPRLADPAEPMQRPAEHRRTLCGGERRP